MNKDSYIELVMKQMAQAVEKQATLAALTSIKRHAGNLVALLQNPDLPCEPGKAAPDEALFLKAVLQALAGSTLPEGWGGYLERALGAPEPPASTGLPGVPSYDYGDAFARFICPNPFSYVELTEKGDLASCCYLPFTLGNVHREPLEAIWHSKEAKALRESMRDGSFRYCDKQKCAAMQEATLPPRETFQYQVPYRLIRKEEGVPAGALPVLRLENPQGPEIISFEDDPSCNLSCPSCRTTPMGASAQMSAALLQRDSQLIDLLGASLRELWFSGAGDPFASAAYRNLLQQYDFAKFPQLRLRLDTNAMLLDPQAWDTVLGKVRERITLVAVSVDAATAPTYAAIRRGGEFGTLVRNLEFIATLPERSTGMGFIIRMIVQQKNFREMKEFVALGKRLGVDSVVFSVMQNWGSFGDDEYLRQAVHLPGHPEHAELCRMLAEPPFAEPLVDLGNLTQLFFQVNGAKGALPVSLREPGQAETAPKARARVIAFYLPQFHPIPENDLWWGKGFTEWTNAGKALPLFEGHYQPHLPGDLGYYDLRVPEVREAQAELAAAYGVEAFCYWHYWFAGHRLLERPFNEVVSSGKPELPFCLGWANQTWSGIWHGAPNRILIEQTYPGLEDYRAHFNALLPAFRDPRHLRVNGKVLFLIYAPQALPDARLFTDYWQELAHKAGLEGFHFVAHSVRNPADFGCHSCVDNAPFANLDGQQLEMQAPAGGPLPRIFHYQELVRTLYNYPLAPEEHPLVVPNWDNTPRSGARGLVLHGSTPELFGVMMEDAVQKAAARTDPQERLVFVKAWNEWAEGNHLEPDRLYGHRYLEVVRDAVFGRKQ